MTGLTGRPIPYATKAHDRASLLPRD